MNQTPEQQAQVERWRVEFEAVVGSYLKIADEDTRFYHAGDYESRTTQDRWIGYFAGREAQQKVCEAEIERLTKERNDAREAGLELFDRVSAAEAQQREGAEKVERFERSQLSISAQFKNFHQRLCERFDYCHDEIDWQRDQVSLIEHIAATIAQLQAQLAAVKGGEPTPVGYVCMGVNGHKYGAFTCDVPQQAKLYLAPPAAQVPDEMPRGEDSDYRNGYSKGWNACRAAMLATQKADANAELTGAASSRPVERAVVRQVGAGDTAMKGKQ